MSRLFRLILRVYFCDPSPKRGGFEQLSTAMEIAGFLRSQTDAIDGKTLRGSHVAL